MMKQLKIFVFITGLLISSLGFGASAGEGAAAPDSNYEEDLTPVHITAQEGRLEDLKSLLNENPEDLNLPATMYKYTPLYLAVMNDHEDVVRYLISQGASPNSKSDGICNYGAKILHIAARYGSENRKNYAKFLVLIHQ